METDAVARVDASGPIAGAPSATKNAPTRNKTRGRSFMLHSTVAHAGPGSAVPTTLLKPQQCATPVDARAERQQHAKMPGFEFPRADLLVDQDGERAGARVAEAVDVRGQLLGGHAQVLADVLVDARIGLVGEKPVDRLDRRRRLGAKRASALGQLGDGELEELASIHGRNVLLLVVVGVLPVRPRPEPAALDVEELRRASVGVDLQGT